MYTVSLIYFYNEIDFSMIMLCFVTTERILIMFTTFAFDIARDVLITPRRLSYVRTKEMELYDNLSGIANKKQEEIEIIIQETADSIKEPLLDEAESLKFQSKLLVLMSWFF